MVFLAGHASWMGTSLLLEAAMLQGKKSKDFPLQEKGDVLSPTKQTFTKYLLSTYLQVVLLG